MFKNVKCINTVHGKLISWDILEGHYPMNISIYGTYEGKGWTLLNNDCVTGQYLDKIRTIGLESVYKLVGTDINGNTTIIDNIGSATYDSKAGLIAKEAHRRERILFNAHPYGKADVIILMYKQSGSPCSICSNTINCPTEGANTACPECFGTGYTGGYYIYPKKEPMLLVDTHDDKLQPPSDLLRNGATQLFRTTFTGMIREKDILCVGMDFYTVNACQCVSSVANIPIAYNVQTFKLLPEDVRYKTLLERVKNARIL
jgi:hypothetical protein